MLHQGIIRPTMINKDKQSEPVNKPDQCGHLTKQEALWTLHEQPLWLNTANNTGKPPSRTGMRAQPHTHGQCTLRTPGLSASTGRSGSGHTWSNQRQSMPKSQRRQWHREPVHCRGWIRLHPRLDGWLVHST